MKTRRNGRISILAVDVGGTHVKCQINGRKRPVRFKSGAHLTPDEMVEKVLKVTTA
jgi:hexokinase